MGGAVLGLGPDHVVTVVADGQGGAGRGRVRGGQTAGAPEAVVGQAGVDEPVGGVVIAVRQSIPEARNIGYCYYSLMRIYVWNDLLPGDDCLPARFLMAAESLSRVMEEVNKLPDTRYRSVAKLRRVVRLRQPESEEGLVALGKPDVLLWRSYDETDGTWHPVA